MGNVQNRMAGGDERPRWRTTRRGGATMAALLLALLATTACGGPSLNSPEGLQHERDMEEEERENRRS